MAFEVCCRLMDCSIARHKPLPALVEEVEKLKEGRQGCTLKIASSDGGFRLIGCETIDERVPELKIGDLVAYHVLEPMTESNSRISFLKLPGFIVAKLAPIYSMEEGGWLPERSTLADGFTESAGRI